MDDSTKSTLTAVGAHKVINGVMSAGATPHGIDMGVLGTMPQYGTP